MKLILLPLVLLSFVAKAEEMPFQYADFNTAFAVEFNTQKTALPTGDHGQSWYPRFAKLKADYHNQIRLAADGAALCVIKSMAQVCWQPVKKRGRDGIQFGSGPDAKIFYPTNLSDAPGTEKELKKFASGEKISWLHDFSILPHAEAADSNTLYKTVDIDGTYVRSFDAAFPGLVAASGKGWQYLPLKPDQASIDGYTKGLKNYAYMYSQTGSGDKIQCSPLHRTYTDKEGRKSELTMNGDNLFTLTKHDGGSTHSFKMGFYNPKYAEEGDGMSSRAVIPFIADSNKFSIPAQMVHVASCPDDKAQLKDCKRLDFGYSPDPGHGWNKEQIDQLGIFTDSDPDRLADLDKKCQTGTTTDCNNRGSAFHARQMDFLKRTEDLQQEMMEMKQVQMACTNPAVHSAAVAQGVAFDGATDVPHSNTGNSNR